MTKITTLEPGNLALIRQRPDGSIQQIALTEEQSKMLQFFLAAISQKDPLVEMGEEHDLILKSLIQ